MRISRLWLQDFRSYPDLELGLDDGLTAIVGPNGVGKTNLLEAIGLLATLKSFRGAPTDSLIRRGAERAVVRAEGTRDDREVLIELEVGARKTRAQVNRQRLQRARDLLGALRITVFAPDDLALVKEGPSVRRGYLDDVAGGHRSPLRRPPAGPRRILQAAKRPAPPVPWPPRRGRAGHPGGVGRQAGQRPGPRSPSAGSPWSSGSCPTSSGPMRSWPAARCRSRPPTSGPGPTPTLAEALAAERDTDIRRGVTSVGPHRDELDPHPRRVVGQDRGLPG